MQTCSEPLMETTETGEDFKNTMAFKVDLKRTLEFQYLKQ